MPIQLHTVNSLYAYSLIVISLYRYYSSINPQVAVLLPIFIAVVLLVCNSGVEYGHRPMTITAYILTIVSCVLFVYQVATSKIAWTHNSQVPLYVLIFFSLISIGYYSISLLKRR